MVEHAGGVGGQRPAGDHVQDRVLAGVEPDARELERRPLAFLEAQHVAVELARRGEIAAQHGEVVHRSGGRCHGLLLESWLIIPAAPARSSTVRGSRGEGLAGAAPPAA